LQAILVHKGSSASHGHYATQLRDEDGSWWELDDDYTCNLSKSTKSKKGVQLGELQSGPVAKGPKGRGQKKKKKAGSTDDPDRNEDDTAGDTVQARRVTPRAFVVNSLPFNETLTERVDSRNLFA